jgi:hypothetical protein
MSPVTLDIVEGLSGVHFLEIEYKGDKHICRMNAQSMEEAVKELLKTFPPIEEYDFEYHCCY